MRLPYLHLLSCWLLALAGAASVSAALGDGPRRLLVQVRDTPPAAGVAFARGRDNSYTVSTGGAGDRDERAPAGAPDNARMLSTAGSTRELAVMEGESIRVDLPSIQSLQFHVPLPGARAPASAATTAPSTIAASTAAAGAAGGPGVAGIVYFEAVSAFSARFSLAGTRVRIELAPLRVGSVAAPMLGADGAASTHPGPIVLGGPVGAWIALGDTQLPENEQSLTPTAQPPTAARVWVRVQPAGAPQP